MNHILPKPFPGLLLLIVWLAGCSAPRLRMGQTHMDGAKTLKLPASIRATETVVHTVPATYLHLQVVQKAGRVYGLEELTVRTDGVVSNPFDPNLVDIQVSFTSPTGQTTRVAAFWYQEYDPHSLRPLGKPGWRVRFTPTQPGEWTARASLSGTTLRSAPLKFAVSADPSARGFVRVDLKNPRYLAFDDGRLYFPIGLNMAWSDDQVLSDYQAWLDQLTKNGGNYIRVWMASRGFGIEWKDTGLGDYTNRLRQAWLLDQVFRMAQERGVYIMLTLINHGAFSTRADPEWSDNPYNAEWDGPCQQPQDFVTDPQAKALFKQRLRYIASRWAYSPNLMAWEWWNEVDWTPVEDDLLSPWIREMTAYLDRHDPYHHLVTTSYKQGERSNLWRMPELSIAQLHDYSGSDPITRFPTNLSRISARAGEKPVLIGEYGNPSLDDDRRLDRDGIHLHNGLWAAPFSGFAGTAMYWWWDHYIDPAGLWHHFKGIAGFLKGEDLAGLTPGKGVLNPDRASALVLSNPERALVWIRSDDYNMPSARIAFTAALLFNQANGAWHYNPVFLPQVTLSLTGLQDGSYIARWYSPQTASWLDETPVQALNGNITLKVPPFDRDLALKVEPLR